VKKFTHRALHCPYNWGFTAQDYRLWFISSPLVLALLESAHGIAVIVQAWYKTTFDASALHMGAPAIDARTKCWLQYRQS
jgi:hypothetical protein